MQEAQQEEQQQEQQEEQGRGRSGRKRKTNNPNLRVGKNRSLGFNARVGQGHRTNAVVSAGCDQRGHPEGRTWASLVQKQKRLDECMYFVWYSIWVVHWARSLTV